MGDFLEKVEANGVIHLQMQERRVQAPARWGLGVGVWGLGFGVWVLGLGVLGLIFVFWFGIRGSGFGVCGLGVVVWGLGFKVQGLGFGVWDSGFTLGFARSSSGALRWRVASPGPAQVMSPER